MAWWGAAPLSGHPAPQRPPPHPPPPPPFFFVLFFSISQLSPPLSPSPPALSGWSSAGWDTAVWRLTGWTIEVLDVRPLKAGECIISSSCTVSAAAVYVFLTWSLLIRFVTAVRYLGHIWTCSGQAFFCCIGLVMSFWSLLFYFKE